MIQYLPLVNACLNLSSTILILAGFYFIKNHQKILHRYSMLGAFATSTLFLISYLTYHFTKTGITVFKGAGIAKAIYLSILISHSILAIFIIPLIFFTINKALKADFESHKKIAKWTFPIWLYVSFTGVVIYILLYQIYI